MSHCPLHPRKRELHLHHLYLPWKLNWSLHAQRWEQISVITCQKWTPGFSQCCNVLQGSAAGRKRKRKRVLKSKMFIDEEEGCMGKSGCALHSLELTLLAILTGQPLPGLWKRFTKALSYPAWNSCPQTEVTVPLVKAWVGGQSCSWIHTPSHYSQIFLQFSSLSSCHHGYRLHLLSSLKLQAFKDGTDMEV